MSLNAVTGLTVVVAELFANVGHVEPFEYEPGAANTHHETAAHHGPEDHEDHEGDHGHDPHTPRRRNPHENEAETTFAMMRRSGRSDAAFSAPPLGPTTA